MVLGGPNPFITYVVPLTTASGFGPTGTKTPGTDMLNCDHSGLTAGRSSLHVSGKRMRVTVSPNMERGCVTVLCFVLLVEVLDFEETTEPSLTYCTG